MVCIVQIVGYMPVYPDSRGCDLDALSFAGWLWIIILLIFFFPLAWLPCVMDSCYEPYQVGSHRADGSGIQENAPEERGRRKME